MIGYSAFQLAQRRSRGVAPANPRRRSRLEIALGQFQSAANALASSLITASEAAAALAAAVQRFRKLCSYPDALWDSLLDDGEPITSAALDERRVLFAELTSRAISDWKEMLP